MGLHSLEHIEIAGISACVPSQVFHTSEYEFFSEKEKADFIKYVGVRSKRDSGYRRTSSDLCYPAAEKVISELQWRKDEIGILIFVTQSADYLMPSTAIILQDKLKLSRNTLAFDINLGCSGWVYGLSVAGSLMKALKISKGLLLAGETSIIVDRNDKAAFPLLGDAGTATALTYAEGDSIMTFNLLSDGSGFDTVIASDSGARYLSSLQGAEQHLKYKGKFNGQKVLTFCLTEVVPAIRELMAYGQKAIEDIDYAVFHQANHIINENLRKKLNLSTGKFPYSINRFGNTSSASIPLTIVTELREQVISMPLSFLCSGFGVGLSWASVLFKTDRLVCPSLIELE